VSHLSTSQLELKPTTGPVQQLDPAPARLLVIRFSSFGDIVQALSIPAAFCAKFPGAKVEWMVRDDFKSLLTQNPLIHKTHSFTRKAGLTGLIAFAWNLAGGDFTHLYDAHCNLRSRVIKAVFFVRRLLQLRRPVKMATRSKFRLRRFLLFKLHLKTLPQPYRGAESFLWPLKKWGVSAEVPAAPLFFTDQTIPAPVQLDINQLTANGSASAPLVALAPSAAWEMKRWPSEHWAELISAWPEACFILLGGPEDDFLSQIQRAAPKRVLNLAGHLTLAQSCAVLKDVDLLIANDTGLLHVSDQLGRPTLALIGPTAFGFPSQKSSVTLEIPLSCRPCSKDGRGHCINSLYKRCLVEITPQAVLKEARRLLDLA
jgi:ADP-heptose:LPS heptosyltransferase